ncbi:MAG: tetratricopeptide repeat protein [Myxococcota bacterium]
MKKSLFYKIFLIVFIFASCNGKDDDTTPDGKNGKGNGKGFGGDPTKFGNVGEGKDAKGQIRKTQEVSKSVVRKFKTVLDEYFKLAKDGYPKDECNKVAEKFIKLKDEKGGEKIVSFLYNAGVTYYRCGMKDKAKDTFKQVLDKDKTFPPAKIALLLMEEIDDIKDLIKHEKDIMRDNYSLQDPDVNYNFALAYYKIYKDTSKKKYFKPLLEYLRRSLANIGKIKNDTLEAVRIRMNVYALAIQFYLLADKNRHADRDLARIFISSARDYIRQCTGRAAIKDQEAREALAKYHNARGLFELYNDEIGNAFREFKKAKDCVDDDYSANLNIGMLGIKFRQPDLAINSLELILNKFPNSKNKFETNLALGVAYKVYGMELQDMADHQFENKEKLQNKLKGLKAYHKEYKKGVKVLKKALSGKVNIRKMLRHVQPYLEEVFKKPYPYKVILKKLNKGDLTIKQLKEVIGKAEAILENSANNLIPERIKDIEKDLALLKDAKSLRNKAKDFFKKAISTYEKVMAQNKKDYRAKFNLAILLYKTGGLVGDMKTNFARARKLFIQLNKNRKVPKDLRKICRKNSSDIKSALVNLEKIEEEKKKNNKAKGKK